MRNIRNLIGMPVIREGKRLGRVIGLRLTDDATRVRGALMDGGIKGTRWIDADAIEMVGDVAVFVKNQGRRARAAATEMYARAITTQGEPIGVASSAYIDPETLQVVALEISRGFWDDLTNGRQRIRHFTVRKSDRVVIVSEEEWGHEGGMDQGDVDRSGARRVGGDDIRNDELADGPSIEPDGTTGREIDRAEDE